MNDHSVPPQHLPAQLTSFVGRERDRAPLATLVDLVRPQQLLLLLDNHVFRYRSTEDWLYTFRAMYGPMLKAFDGLNASAQERLAGDLLDVANRFNRSGDHPLAAPAEYLEAIAVTSRIGGPAHDHPEDWR